MSATESLRRRPGEFVRGLRGGAGARTSEVAGGTILFVSTALVNGGNYLFNLILGRWLGPADFSDLSLVVTLLLLLSFATSTLGMIAARFTAMRFAEQDTVAIASYRDWLRRIAWIGGIVAAAAMIAGSPLLKRFFHTGSLWPFVLLGVGLPLYFAQGVDRGVLQGGTRFTALSVSYQAEMWTRLLGGMLLVGLGLGVSGAVGAITGSFVATWFLVRRALEWLGHGHSLSAAERQAVIAFSGPVVLGLAGQILINNSDVLIVKHFFGSDDAGHYAALALIGRVVFFAAWPIATVIFPIAAQRAHRGEPHGSLALLSIGVALAIGGTITLACAVMPRFIVRVLFGAEYLDIANVLWLYALATTLYTVASTLVQYQLGLGKIAGSVFTLVTGMVQVVLLVAVHDSLRQVVQVQLALMGILCAITLIWTFGPSRAERGLEMG
jgi:O-antigen/teichoic acid export membrane protein